MQRHSEQSLYLTKKLGEVVRKLRLEKSPSVQKFADEYDLVRSNCARIEQGKIDCKFTSLWKIAQALGIKLSDLIKILEQELGEGFTLIDE